MDLEEERLAASINFQKLASSMPAVLSRREDAIAIRLRKSKASSENKLLLLYEFMDEIYTYSSKYTACKKGCSHCCSYEVTVSEIEIQHIEKHTKAKRNKPYLNSRNFHGTECTFLIDGKCSIYSSRPYVCRRHVALTKTNHWCQPELSKMETFTLLNYTGIDEAYNVIRGESNSREFVDIRQVFGEK